MSFIDHTGRRGKNVLGFQIKLEKKALNLECKKKLNPYVKKIGKLKVFFCGKIAFEFHRAIWEELKQTYWLLRYELGKRIDYVIK